MSYFVWKDEYSVGVDEIDFQHKKLISIISELHSAMIEGKSDSVIDDVLEKMRDYTKEHFSTEEGYMLKADYGQYIEHKSRHEKFIQKTETLVYDMKAKKKFISIDIMDFLRNWLSAHILGDDMKYKDCLKKAGF